MVTIQTITVARAKAIEDATVVGGQVNTTTGHLMLSTYAGSQIDAGKARRDPVTPTRLIYTATTTFVKANYPGMTRLRAELWGGGGSGGAGGAVEAGGGGGGGGYFVAEFLVAELKAVTTIIVGAGGSVSGPNQEGVSGGSTSLVDFTSGSNWSIGAGGGAGGRRTSGESGVVGCGGGGGTDRGGAAAPGTSAAMDGVNNAAGAPGGFGLWLGGFGATLSTSSFAGATYYGGGGGGGRRISGRFGSSVFGGGGGGMGDNTRDDDPLPGGLSLHGGPGGDGGAKNAAGSAGGFPAGGGGGGGRGTSPTAGGVGANGQVILTVFYN